jgi:hypothetical protein
VEALTESVIISDLVQINSPHGNQQMDGTHCATSVANLSAHPSLKDATIVPTSVSTRATQADYWVSAIAEVWGWSPIVD